MFDSWHQLQRTGLPNITSSSTVTSYWKVTSNWKVKDRRPEVMLYALPNSCTTDTPFATHVFQWWGVRWSQCQTVVLSVQAWTSDSAMRNCWQTSCVHLLAKNAACIPNLARLIVYNGATSPFENRRCCSFSITTENTTPICQLRSVTKHMQDITFVGMCSNPTLYLKVRKLW